MDDDRRLSVLGNLDDCVRREREGMARFLECLGEFDAREWYSSEAFSSSFAYLTEHLKIPHGSAWKRLVVARAARRFPIILSLLREGKVHLTGLSLVAKMLDESNVDFVLNAITGKTTRQIDEFVADFKALALGDSEGEGSTSLKGSGGTLTPLGLGNWKMVVSARSSTTMDVGALGGGAFNSITWCRLHGGAGMGRAISASYAPLTIVMRLGRRWEIDSWAVGIGRRDGDGPRVLSSDRDVPAPECRQSTRFRCNASSPLRIGVMCLSALYSRPSEENDYAPDRCPRPDSHRPRDFLCDSQRGPRPPG